MIDNFERLVSGVTSIYKNIQKIKKSEMNLFGLSGKYAMPFYYLLAHPEGLTSTQLKKMCYADKAAVSRTLSEMEEAGFLYFEGDLEKKRYRSKIFLTEEGKKRAREIRRVILHLTFENGQKISEEERVIFYHVLELIRANLQKACDEHEVI